MRLSQQAIEKFKKLYFEEYGVILTEQEAHEYSRRLIWIVKAIYGNGKKS